MKPLGFKRLKVRRSFCAQPKNTQLLMFRISYVKTNYGIKQRPKKKVTMVKSSFFDRKSQEPQNSIRHLAPDAQLRIRRRRVASVLSTRVTRLAMYV
jgi:hypothetical protein